MSRRRWSYGIGSTSVGGLVLAGIVTVIAGCAGSGTTTGASGGATGASTANVATACNAVKSFETPPKWTAPGPPIPNAASVLKGKTLYYVAGTLSIPFDKALTGGVREAAHALGMNVIFVDAHGSTAEATRLIQQGIGRRASVFASDGLLSSGMSAALKEAHTAGIPYFAGFEGNPGRPPANEVAYGVTWRFGFNFATVGRTVADWIVCDTKGKADVGLFDEPDVGISTIATSAYSAEMRRLCPQCSSTVVHDPVANWQTGGYSLASSLLKRKPTLNYFWPLVDGMVQPLKPAIAAAGKDSQVKLVSYNADLPDMQAVKKGGDPEVAALGASEHWEGWLLVDSIARHFAKMPPVSSAAPDRMFTHANTQSLDLSADESTWYETDFRTPFEKLWGLK
jgi:ribose transport system substrate-binding protein